MDLLSLKVVLAIAYQCSNSKGFDENDDNGEAGGSDDDDKT